MKRVVSSERNTCVRITDMIKMELRGVSYCVSRGGDKSRKCVKQRRQWSSQKKSRHSAEDMSVFRTSSPVWCVSPWVCPCCCCWSSVCVTERWEPTNRKPWTHLTTTGLVCEASGSCTWRRRCSEEKVRKLWRIIKFVLRLIEVLLIYLKTFSSDVFFVSLCLKLTYIRFLYKNTQWTTSASIRTHWTNTANKVIYVVIVINVSFCPNRTYKQS